MTNIVDATQDEDCEDLEELIEGLFELHAAQTKVLRCLEDKFEDAQEFETLFATGLDNIYEIQAQLDQFWPEGEGIEHSEVEGE